MGVAAVGLPFCETPAPQSLAPHEGTPLLALCGGGNERLAGVYIAQSGGEERLHASGQVRLTERR